MTLGEDPEEPQVTLVTLTFAFLLPFKHQTLSILRVWSKILIMMIIMVMIKIIKIIEPRRLASTVTTNSFPRHRLMQLEFVLDPKP